MPKSSSCLDRTMFGRVTVDFIGNVKSLAKPRVVRFPLLTIWPLRSMKSLSMTDAHASSCSESTFRWLFCNVTSTVCAWLEPRQIVYGSVTLSVNVDWVLVGLYALNTLVKWLTKRLTHLKTPYAVSLTSTTTSNKWTHRSAQFDTRWLLT